MENNSRSGLLKEEIDLLVLRYGISREFLQNYLHDSSFKKNTGIENIENIPLLEVKNVNN